MRQHEEARLADLLSRVNEARTSLRAERSQPMTVMTRAEYRIRCAALVEAMGAYAAAATDAGIPLPYRYRDEMRLYRSMASA
jgi:hypothetical protein